MPFDRKTYGKEPTIIKGLKGFVRRTEARQAQDDRAVVTKSQMIEEARKAPKRMLEGMEKFRKSRSPFKLGEK